LQAATPIDQHGVAQVQLELKRQIGVFMQLDAADNLSRGAELWTAAQTQEGREAYEKRFWCGIGDVDFKIDSVKVEMLTSTETTKKLSAKFSIFANLSEASDDANSQDLQFSLGLSAHQPNITPLTGLTADQRAALLSAAPIAAVLLSTRDGFIAAARKNPGDDPRQTAMPCFADLTDGDKNGSHSVKIAAEVTRTGEVSTITLTSVALGPSLEIKSGSNTSIAVSFSHQPLLTYEELDSKTMPARLRAVAAPRSVSTADVRRAGRSLLVLAADETPAARRGTVQDAREEPKPAPPQDPCAGLDPPAAWVCKHQGEMQEISPDSPTMADRPVAPKPRPVPTEPQRPAR
jgi:hypothetical protein